MAAAVAALDAVADLVDVGGQSGITGVPEIPEATEIARAVTHAAFEDPAVDHVEIHHDRNNEASAGIPRKLGFRYAGNRRSEKAAAAETGVESIWRTTRTEWLGDRR